MYLLLVVLKALCELINDLRRVPQMEPVRLPADERDSSTESDSRRTEPSRCGSYLATLVPRQIPRPLAFRGERARSLRPGEGRLRWRRRF